MALDLHVLKSGRPAELLYSITFEQYQRIKPALLLLKSRTGLQVDLYQDLKLSSGLAPLIGAFTDALSRERNLMAKKEMESLLVVLKNAESRNESLVFVGD